MRDATRLQKVYGSQITIGLGCEVGFNPDHVEATLARMEKYTFDWIGLSYHFHRVIPNDLHFNLVGKRDQRVLNLQQEEAESIISAYFTNLTSAVDYIPCNMLCHLDAVLRYHPHIQDVTLPWDLIEELLKKMAQKGIAMEVNTSGLLMRGESFPCQRIIQMAQALEVHMVLGSDSHRPENVGYGFERLQHLIIS